MKTSFFFCLSRKRRLRQRTDAVRGLEEQHHIIRVSLIYSKSGLAGQHLTPIVSMGFSLTSIHKQH